MSVFYGKNGGRETITLSALFAVEVVTLRITLLKKRLCMVLSALFLGSFLFACPANAGIIEDILEKMGFQIVYFEMKVPYLKRIPRSTDSSENEGVEKGQAERAKEKEALLEIRKEYASFMINDMQRLIDPNSQNPESFQHFVALGYALAYNDVTHILSLDAKTSSRSPFEGRTVVLENQDSFDDVVILQEASIKEHLLKALGKFVKSGTFQPSRGFNGFYVKNASKESYRDFKNSVCEISSSQVQEGNAIDKAELVGNLSSLLSDVVKSKSAADSLWVVCTLGNPQGGYDVYLQEIRMEPLKPKNLLKRFYTPSNFVRLSKSEADTYLQGRFSQVEEYPYVNKTGPSEFEFRFADITEYSSQETAYPKAFARGVMTGLIKTSRAQ